MLSMRRPLSEIKEHSRSKVPAQVYSSVMEYSTSMHEAQVQFPVMEKKQRRKANRTKPYTFAALGLPLAVDSTTGTYLNSPGPKCHFTGAAWIHALYGFSFYNILCCDVCLG